MLALVILEAIAVGLLGLLVASLLRSHAEILRQLHSLSAGRDQAPPVARRDQAPSAARPFVGSVDGVTPGGETVSVALDRPGERSMLLFLSSGCGTCGEWWDALRRGDHRGSPWRTIVVTRGADEESPSLLRGLAPADITVVLSSTAWEVFAVPGSPYAVLVDGAAGGVIGEGVARSWGQLASLVGQHLGDVTGGQQADAALLAAGIGPGHPSLYPEPQA